MLANLHLGFRRDSALRNKASALDTERDSRVRQLIEELLIVRDWGEAFAALNLCVKPALDELFLVELPRVAEGERDPLLGALCFSLMEDCRWHQAWAAALVRVAVTSRAENRDVLRDWTSCWWARLSDSLLELAPSLVDEGSVVVDRATSRVRGWLSSLELAP